MRVQLPPPPPSKHKYSLKTPTKEITCMVDDFRRIALYQYYPFVGYFPRYFSPLRSVNRKKDFLAVLI